MFYRNVNANTRCNRHHHGGKSKGTTCVVDRDVTAYMVVDRVLRFPTHSTAVDTVS